VVNYGIDEPVRGVQRLKKSSQAFREVYYKSMVGGERHRALINGQFMHEMSGEEEADALRLASLTSFVQSPRTPRTRPGWPQGSRKIPEFLE
jgi:hypothetical protein